MTTLNDHDAARLSDIELLRRAIDDADTRPSTRSFELSQIYSGFVRGRADLETLWLELTAQTNARADFHVDGVEIQDHSIRADTAVSLIKGVIEATTKTAKHRLKEIREAADGKDTKHRTANGGRPLLLAPFRPGSFEFSVETQPVPPSKDVSEGQAELNDGRALESIDDRALIDVVDVLYSAGDSPTLQKLPHNAQQALLPAAKVLAQGGLEISVRITQRNRQPIRLTHDHGTATQLVVQLEAPRVTARNGQATFRFDGYRESDQSVFLLLKDKSQRFSVADPSLLSEIRALPIPDGITWVACDYTIKVTTAAGKKTETEFALTYATRTEAPSLAQLEADEKHFREALNDLRTKANALDME